MSPLILKSRPESRPTTDEQFISDCEACGLTPSTMLLSVSLPDGTPALALERAHDRFEVWRVDNTPPLERLAQRHAQVEPRDEPTYPPLPVELPDSPAMKKLADAMDRQASVMEAQHVTVMALYNKFAPLLDKTLARIEKNEAREAAHDAPAEEKPRRAKKSKKVAPNDA